MNEQPDLALVADMLRCRTRYLPDSISEQARLCELAHNATGVARTVNRSNATGVAGDGLPELPESYGDHCTQDSVRTMREPGYTAEQMRAYAIEARRLATPEQPGSAVQGEK